MWRRLPGFYPVPCMKLISESKYNHWVREREVPTAFGNPDVDALLTYMLRVVKAASEMNQGQSELYLCFMMVCQQIYMPPNETWYIDCEVLVLSEKCGFALSWKRPRMT